MRNILAFPATDQEIIQCLEEYLDIIRNEIENDSGLCGDMRPTLIRLAIERIRDNPKDLTGVS